MITLPMARAISRIGLTRQAASLVLSGDTRGKAAVVRDHHGVRTRQETVLVPEPRSLIHA